MHISYQRKNFSQLCQENLPEPALPLTLPGLTGTLDNFQTSPLAVPSWVKPGTLAENCRWLAGKVGEVGLLFMESRASLEYGPTDLPEWLAELPLSWHVHLPTDLPWEQPEKAAGLALALMDKLAFLKVRRAVLHPYGASDAKSARRLKIFTQIWSQSGRDSADLLLENLPGHRLHSPAPWLPWIEELTSTLNLSICFDFGHFFLHNGPTPSHAHTPVQAEPEQDLLEQLPDSLVSRIGLVHCCPASHRSLSTMSTAEQAAAERFCRRLAKLRSASNSEPASEQASQAGKEALFMLEMFNWDFILESHPILCDWLKETNLPQGRKDI